MPLLFVALALCACALPTRAQKPEDLHQRALARFEQGDVEGALADLDKATKLFPKYDAAYYARAQIKKSRGDIEGALADFTKAIEADPQYAEAYASRGLILLSRNLDADAQKDFDKYLQLNPAAKDSLDRRIKYAKYQRTKKPKP